MTDEQIVEALAYCVSTKSCEECPICNTDNCGFVLMRNAFDLIERQQAEIEQWKEEANKYQNMWCATTEDIQMAKDEAVREFAKKLEGFAIFCEFDNGNGKPYFEEVVNFFDIERIKEEMTKKEGGADE